MAAFDEAHRFREQLTARFAHVPDPEPSAGGFLRGELSRMRPSDYASVLAWPMSDFLVFLESNRVQRFHDEVADAVAKAKQQLLKRL